MEQMFEVGGATHCLWLTRENESYRLHFENSDVSVALADGNLHIDRLATPVHIAHDGDKLYIHVDGGAHELRYREPVSYHSANAGSGLDDIMRAPMPGVVVTLSVKEGQAVQSGDSLLVIESMKLETLIRAPRDGIVESVHVAAGASFERDAPLISLAPRETSQ